MHGSFVSSPTNSVTADFKASRPSHRRRVWTRRDDGDDGDDGDEEVFPRLPVCYELKMTTSACFRVTSEQTRERASEQGAREKHQWRS